MGLPNQQKLNELARAGYTFSAARAPEMKKLNLPDPYAFLLGMSTIHGFKDSRPAEFKIDGLHSPIQGTITREIYWKRILEKRPGADETLTVTHTLGTSQTNRSIVTKEVSMEVGGAFKALSASVSASVSVSDEVSETFYSEITESRSVTFRAGHYYLDWALIDKISIVKPLQKMPFSGMPNIPFLIDPADFTGTTRIRLFGDSTEV